jgi:hypothetical protein
MQRFQVFLAKAPTKHSQFENGLDRFRIPGAGRTGTLGPLLYCLGVLVLMLIPQSMPAQTAITTFHYDNGRTGWNSKEATLTPANVAGSSFGILQTIPLDGQPDAQPLVVPNEQIKTGNFQGIHNVVYVATENNTIYAIDYDTGTVLLSPNFGAPVPTPGACPTNPLVGINSTPVLNLATNTMYVMVYTMEANGPVYRLHALGLGTLTDQIPPVVVTASQKLTDGSTFNFNATYQRQRPALLLSNGNVYAGFGSFCDHNTNVTRGWLLGWQADTLTPLQSVQLLDTQATSPDNYFLSPIWMSGWGIAADGNNDLYFVTGNSDPSGNTYDGVTNLQESVVKVSSDLTQVLDLFTPFDWPTLDANDKDFGSGGIMLLPPRPPVVAVKTMVPPPLPAPAHLALAAGKTGDMFLMNQEDLGGYDPTANHVLGTFTIGNCFCGASYFLDPKDRSPRVVTSGGNVVAVWKLQTSPSVTLTNIAQSGSLFPRNHGFNTTVSSNGLINPIIWAVARQTFQTPALLFFAFDPEAGDGKLNPIFSTSSVGTWPYPGNANLVPVVANGKVFVGAAQQLTIFGLGAKQKNGVAKTVPR